MIDPRRAQHNFGDKLIADQVKDLQENWIIHADQVLADQQILTVVYEALAKRRSLSRTRGRRGYTVEVVLRLLILHVRNWSYIVLEREVRANLVYRNFTRVGFAKMPDAKTMGRWGVALGPEVIKHIHERIVTIAQQLLFSFVKQPQPKCICFPVQPLNLFLAQIKRRIPSPLGAGREHDDLANMRTD